MHNETLEKLTNAAKNKINMLNNSKLKFCRIIRRTWNNINIYSWRTFKCS